MPVIFLTDALFLTLVASGVVATFYIRRHPHLLIPWRKLSRKRSAMISLVIIMFYLTVALLDSLHFKVPVDSPEERASYGTDIISVFDYLVAPILIFGKQEKTFSEPFSTHSFSKETRKLPDGSWESTYPRLKIADAHSVGTEGGSPRGVLPVLFRALAWALIFLTLLYAAFFIRRARRTDTSVWEAVQEVMSGKSAVPWREALLAFSLLVLLLTALFAFSTHYHVFGTDKVGGDVFYKTLKSIRTGVLIGTLTTIFMLPFALLLGVVAGYFLGWVDDVIQYVYTTLNSIPSVLLIAAGVLMLQVYMAQHEADFASVAERSNAKLLFLCLVLGVTSWTGLCRLLRAETLKVKSMDYIQAARCVGVGRLKIILRHVLPNVAHIVFITTALEFSTLVLAEAILSYINIGVDPAMNSWGNMISSARLEMAREPEVWWSLVASLIFMFGLVLCANLFADAVRDAFDPHTEAHRTPQLPGKESA